MNIILRLLNMIPSKDTLPNSPFTENYYKIQVNVVLIFISEAVMIITIVIVKFAIYVKFLDDAEATEVQIKFVIEKSENDNDINMSDKLYENII